MKLPLAALMLLLSSVAMTTEAATRSSAVYGYCIGCTEWKEHIKENDNFLFPTVAKAAPSTSELGTSFIPWPTTATLQLTSASPAVFSISNESHRSRDVDFTAPRMPLARTKRLVFSSKPSNQEYQLLDSNLPSQQFEEGSFLLICFVVVAVAAYVYVMVYVITYVEKEDKLSSTTGDEDFDILGLVPTIDEEGERGDIMAEVRTVKTRSKSILVGSFSSEGKCAVKQKTEKRVHFEDEKDKGTSTVPARYNDCKSSMQYACNNSFQDMVSNEILKLLLKERVDKSDTSPLMPSAAAEKKEEQHAPQDVPPKKSVYDEESSSVGSNMIREYEDFLFQVSHSVH